jgi:hypothetical protein
MGKTPNLTALTAQLAEMQATLGRLAGPAEGSGNPPSAGEVSLYDFWLKHMDGKKPPKLNEQYRTALAHLNNRVRNCDDCGTVIIPLKRKHRREKTEFMQRRNMPAMFREYTMYSRSLRIDRKPVDCMGFATVIRRLFRSDFAETFNTDSSHPERDGRCRREH